MCWEREFYGFLQMGVLLRWLYAWRGIQEGGTTSMLVKNVCDVYKMTWHHFSLSQCFYLDHSMDTYICRCIGICEFIQGKRWANHLRVGAKWTTRQDPMGGIKLTNSINNNMILLSDVCCLKRCKGVLCEYVSCQKMLYIFLYYSIFKH